MSWTGTRGREVCRRKRETSGEETRSEGKYNSRGAKERRIHMEEASKLGGSFKKVKSILIKKVEPEHVAEPAKI